MSATAQTSRSVVVPVIAVGACLAALLIGGALTRPNLDWYATLAKPGFAPSNSIFPVVWPILYALDGDLRLARLARAGQGGRP